MKWLPAINLVLTLCVLILVLARNDAPDPVPRPDTQTVSSIESAPVMAPATIDEQRLRQIIREELAASDGMENDRNATESQPRDAEADRHQREFVAQQIEYYKSVGRISTQEMNELQQEIARLDQDGRREMLSRLTRALNARQIEGQF